MSGTERLTSLAKAGGCAAKYSAARLEQLLAGLVPAEAHDLLVGLDPADDAAVYRLDDDDGARLHRRLLPARRRRPARLRAIAATNALNDVFAMGGLPLLALSVTAFPEELPVEMLGEILAGADEAVRAAGAILAGGHTIRDDEPKYGLAVVGTVHPDGIWRKSTARGGRRRLPHQGARHRARPPGRAGRRRARRGARGRDRGDVRVESRRRRHAAPVRAARRHRRDRVRAARSRARDGVALAACGSSSTPRRCPRCPARWSSPRPASAPGATGATASSPARTSTPGRPRSSRRSPTTRRRRAGCSSRSPADKRAVVEATFAAAGLPLHAVGRVEARVGGRARREACPRGLRGPVSPDAVPPARRCSRSGCSGSSSPPARSSG